ncbi:cytochrome P450 [Chytridium lagenaria]|nr:cytochrome P450 [Chytridium lagenaria]
MDFFANHTGLSIIVGVVTAALAIDAIASRKNVTKLHERYARMRRECGPISRSQIVGGIHFITVTEAETCRQVRLIVPMAEGIFKYGLFIMPTDELWRKHRKFLQPGFGPSQLRRALEATNVTMDKLLNLWTQREDELGESYHPEMFHIALSITVDVIGHVAFSYDYNCTENHEDPESLAAMKTYQRAFDIINLRFSLPSPCVRKDLEFLRETIKSTIEPKRLQCEERNRLKQELVEDECGDAEDADDKFMKNISKLDVLDRLIETSEWTDDEITDEVIALFLAGGDTSANTMTWVVLTLDQNPEARRKMMAEIDSVLGDAEHVTNAMLGQLKYVECVIKETLRLYPAVPVPVGRTVIKDVVLGGHKISKGTVVWTDIMSLHHDEKYWKDPLAFIPERWVDFTPLPGTFLAFGEGPHMCIGQKLAMIELKTVLSRIYRSFLPRVVPGQDLEPITSVTYGLKSGLRSLSRRGFDSSTLFFKFEY